MNKIRIKIVIIVIILGVGVCYYSMINPNFINKQVYIMFGKNQFSNKALKVNIVDEFNEKTLTEIGRKKVTYFHEFTDEELSWIKSLEIRKKFNSSDIKLLDSVNEVVIKDVKINDEIVIQGDSKLKKIEFINVTVESLKILDTGINDIVFSDTNINELNISNNPNLTNLYSYDSYVNNAIFKENDNFYSTNGVVSSKINLYSSDENWKSYFQDIKFNKLVIDEDKEISLPNGNYFYVNFDQNNFKNYSEGKITRDYYLKHNYQIYKMDYNYLLDAKEVTINNLMVKVYDVDNNFLEIDKTYELNGIYDHNIFDYDYIEFYDNEKLVISFGNR